jgi:RecA/RadA recombinase
MALSAVFDLLDAERSSVIDGLDRFGARQKELAAALREDTDKLRALQADPASDAGEVNQMVQRVTWEAQVFQDRRQALGFACEVPSKIEQRLFAVARATQDAIE